MSVAGVVLTGGSSRRMGADKALIEIDGVAMARRVADALTGAGAAPVWCQGGDVTGLRSLGLAAEPDDQPGRGPVVAIAQAVAVAAPGRVVVCACDLVDVDSASIERLIGVAEAEPSLEVVVAADRRRPHLLAVFQGTAAQRLAELVADDVVAFHTAIDRLQARLVAIDPRAVRNVNRPDDMR